MKKIVTIVSGLAIALGLGSANAFAEEPVPGLVYNAEVQQIENIQNVNGRVMLPFRAVFEMMGATVDYEDGTRKVTAVRGDKTVEFYADGTSIKVIDSTGVEEIPAEIGFDYEKDRVMVPVRFVSNALGARVGWEDSEKTVYVLDTYPLIQSIKTDCPDFVKFTELASKLEKNISDTAALNLELSANIPETLPVKINLGVNMTAKQFNNTGEANVKLNFTHENLNALTGYNLGQLEDAEINCIKTDSAMYFKTNIVSKISEFLPEETSLHMAESFVGSDTWFRLDYSYVQKELGKAMADILFGKTPDNIDSVLAAMETVYTMTDADVTAYEMYETTSSLSSTKAVLAKAKLVQTDENNYKFTFNFTTDDIIEMAASLAPLTDEDISEIKNYLTFDMTASTEVVNGVETSENVSFDFSVKESDTNLTLKLTASEKTAKSEQAPQITVPTDALSIESIMILLGM